MVRGLESIRNVGIIAHIDAGKTTTTEGMLFYSGRTHRFGDIDDGTTVMDYLDEEKERGITITAAAASFPWKEHLIHLIDTPGHIDFTAEVERSLRVIDGAVVIFSAVEGVEAQSEKVWRQAEKYRVPKIAFINKMDRIGASFERVIHEIDEKFGNCALALQIPIGLENEFRGVIDLIAMQALRFSGDENEIVARIDLTEEERNEALLWREHLVERLAEESDEIAERYLEGQEIESERLIAAIRDATLTGRLVPVFVGAAKRKIGIQPLADGIVQYLPSPLDVGAVSAYRVKDERPVEIAPDPKAPFSGLVFKLTAGASADLLYVRTYSGTLKEGAVLINSRTGEKVRARQLLRLYAKNTQPLPEVGPGDIIGMIGPRNCETGDALCDFRHRVAFERIVFPEPVLSVAVEPKSSRDKDRLDAALRLLCREDPTLQLGFDEDTGQRILAGMGELHLEVNLKRLQVEARVGEPRVAYRETFRDSAVLHYAFTRMLGDNELFAAVRVGFRPMSRGEEFFQVRNSLPARKAVPKAWLAAAEKALLDGMRTGGVHGYPLIYVEAELQDLEVHPEKTTEAAVIGAVLGVVDKAIREIGTLVLEPVMRLEVFAPENTIGEVTAFLQPRRAVIREMQPAGSVHRLVCEVPLGEMFGFGKALPKLTGGRGTFTMVPAGYQAVPPEVAERLFGIR